MEQIINKLMKAVTSQENFFTSCALRNILNTCFSQNIGIQIQKNHIKSLLEDLDFELK